MAGFIIQFASDADRQKIMDAIAANQNAGIEVPIVHKRDPWLTVTAPSRDVVEDFNNGQSVIAKIFDDVRGRPIVGNGNAITR